MSKLTLHDGLIYAFLVVYILYALGGIGMPGLLFSLAIGLIALSFDMSLEIIVACVIFSGIAWKLVMDRKKEGFQVPMGKGQSGLEVVKKIMGIEQKDVFEPSATLSNSYVEGFEDAEQTTSPTPASPSAPAGPAAPAPPANSTPAPTNAPTTTPQLQTALPATATTSGFSDKAADGMFKLGSIPADTVGGAHIDIGTTMMNALNSLKPDQVKQMTDDTRKLLETQKSLMGMLSTMKPMLQDGKQLMSTFNDMFGKGGPTPMPSM